jgi:hypothetical protein
LIYNEEAETMKKEQHRLFEIGSPRDDDEEMPDDCMATTPVSDSAFQRMLSQHSLNSRFDNLNSLNDPDVVPTKSPAFQDKLDRLMQQKHRQYEKKAIVEKHQQRRAKERRHTRDQERRDRHMAMEREIEAIEETFSSPLERTRAMHQLSPKRQQPYSPKPYASNRAQYSPKPNRQYSPKPIRQYSPKAHQSHSEASPAPSAARASPFRANIGRSSSYQEQTEPTYRPSTGQSSPYRPNNGSAIFRKAPKISYGVAGHPVTSSQSTRSVSPPGGMEDDRKFQMRPRTSQPMGIGIPHSNSNSMNYHQNHPHDLFVDTSRADYYARDMDHSTLDKLSMPPMMNFSTGPKHPSPNSVMDELMQAPTSNSNVTARRRTPPQRHPDAHRRVNSLDPQAFVSHGNGRTIGGKLPPSSQQQQQQQFQRRTPSKTGGSSNHRRSNSNSSHVRSHSSGRAQQHSRSNSHSDDVFLHGIVAQTRFV